MSLPPPLAPCCVQILTKVAQGVRWSWWGLGWDSSGLHLLTPLPWVRGVALAAGLAPTSRSQGNLACWAPGQGPGLPGATGWRCLSSGPGTRWGWGLRPPAWGLCPLPPCLPSASPGPAQGGCSASGHPCPAPQAADGLELGWGSQLSGPSVGPRAFQGVYGIAQCLYGAAHVQGPSVGTASSEQPQEELSWRGEGAPTFLSELRP